jgi:hypothetical protein
LIVAQRRRLVHVAGRSRLRISGQTGRTAQTAVPAPVLRSTFLCRIQRVAGYELGLLPDGAPEDGALVYWGVDGVAAAVRAAIEAGSTEHTPPSDVGDGIVTATVRTPQHTVVGFIDSPHFNTA